MDQKKEKKAAKVTDDFSSLWDWRQNIQKDNCMTSNLKKSLRFFDPKKDMMTGKVTPITKTETQTLSNKTKMGNKPRDITVNLNEKTSKTSKSQGSDSKKSSGSSSSSSLDSNSCSDNISVKDQIFLRQIKEIEDRQGREGKHLSLIPGKPNQKMIKPTLKGNKNNASPQNQTNKKKAGRFQATDKHGIDVFVISDDEDK